MNNKSELTAGLSESAVNICHKTRPDAFNGSISYQLLLERHVYYQKAYDDYFGGRSDGLLNLPYHQDVNF